VKDPEVAKLLTPTDFPIGARRVCVDIDYFETFNRDNVKLVDIKNTPIEEITAKGVKVGDKEYEVDEIIFATGFDAMTGSLAAIDIRGVGGKTLRDHWAAAPVTLLGLMTAEFPNIFFFNGIGTPYAISNVVVSIEQHVEWVADLLDHLRKNNLKSVVPTLTVIVLFQVD
jgi:cyclohexanone monooxygenase